MANYLLGGRGDDLLEGAGGDDRLKGGAGSDQIAGGAGSDVLEGGIGDDIFGGGGAGDDAYDFERGAQLGTDTILELTGEGEDTLDLSEIPDPEFISPDFQGPQQVSDNLSINFALPGNLEHAPALLPAAMEAPEIDSSTSDTFIAFNWTPVENATGYTVERKIDDGNWIHAGNGTQLGSDFWFWQSISGQGSQYQYRVSSANAWGQSADNQALDFQTELPAPSGLTAEKTGKRIH